MSVQPRATDAAMAGDSRQRGPVSPVCVDFSDTMNFLERTNTHG